MNIFKQLLDSVGGSLVDSVVGVVKDYFPPSMSDQEKAKMEAGISKMMHKHELQMLKATTDMEKTFNDRIKTMEGTAADLRTIPIIGPVIIFLRGMQRPTWGFGTLYVDIQVFSGNWALVDGSQVESCFWIVNLLVLGFLFGERAVKNLSPLIERMLKK